MSCRTRVALSCQRVPSSGHGLQSAHWSACVGALECVSGRVVQDASRVVVPASPVLGPPTESPPCEWPEGGTRLRHDNATREDGNHHTRQAPQHPTPPTPANLHTEQTPRAAKPPPPHERLSHGLLRPLVSVVTREPLRDSHRRSEVPRSPASRRHRSSTGRDHCRRPNSGLRATSARPRFLTAMDVVSGRHNLGQIAP